MKVNSTTTYILDFPMKDGKKVHSFKMAATDPIEAEELLREELLECCRQIQAEEKLRNEKAVKKTDGN